MALPDEYLELLKAHGIDLQETFCIADIALTREATLQAIDILEDAGSVILGGDVYLMTGEGLRFALANWYTNRNPGETDQSLVARSANDSRNYVTHFKDPQGSTAYFSLVVQND